MSLYDIHSPVAHGSLKKQVKAIRLTAKIQAELSRPVAMLQRLFLFTPLDYNQMQTLSVNNQPPEKQDISPGNTLDVHSIFYTIQGEGEHVGNPAVFLRLAGCNLCCKACDTDYTSTRSRMTLHEIDRLVYEKIKDTKPNGKRLPLLVITGGEPFRQNILPLIINFSDKNWIVQIETNGTIPPQTIDPGHYYRCSIVCSPKASSICNELKPYITSLKYILRAGMVCPHDGLPLSHLGQSGPVPVRPWPSYFGQIFIQPEWSDDKAQYNANVAACVESAKKFQYRISLQTHKLIGVE